MADDPVCLNDLPIDICEAIHKLRPQFGIRQQLREQIIIELDTYFQTIPKDVLMIIREYVPMLQQTIDQEQIERERQAFLKKYQYDETDTYHIPTLNRVALIRDFPEYVEKFMGNSAAVKFVNGKLCVFYHSVRYIGQNMFYVTNSRGRSFIITVSRDKDPDNISSAVRLLSYNRSPHIMSVLPCGLVYEYLDQFNKHYLTDYRKRESYFVNPPIFNEKPYTINEVHNRFIDDYGIVTRINVESGLSDKHILSMQVKLKDKSDDEIV